MHFNEIVCGPHKSTSTSLHLGIKSVDTVDASLLNEGAGKYTQKPVICYLLDKSTYNFF